MGNFNRGEKSGSGGGFGRRNSGRHGSSRRGGGEREMHDAICGNCGNECKIPFKPSDGRPVFCNDCFDKKDGGASSSRRRPKNERRNESRPQNNQQLREVNRKLDEILEKLIALSLKEEKETATKPLEVIIIDQKSTKTTKKKPAVKKKSSVKKIRR